MTPWILLLFTLVSAYITLETMGLIGYFKEHPKTLFTWIWGNRGEILYNQSPNNLKQYIIHRTNQKMVIFTVGVTLTLASATFKAFMN